MRHLLAKLAEHAGRAGTALLMTLDELHSGDREELRRLSADLQHITKRSGLPLAVIAAGLSELKHTLLMDKKMTFFRRCARLDMPDLTVADALQGLRLPVIDAGGAFDQEALRFAARACGPLPYTMQLIGYNAWKIAGAPDRSIDMLAVEEACALAEEQVLEDLIEPAWYDLAASSRAFLTAVAELGPEVEHQRLAVTLPASPQALADTERRLRASGYIAETANGALCLTGLMPRDAVRKLSAWALRFDRHIPSSRTDALEVDAIYTTQRSLLEGCREYMPRARAYCVLRKDHAGGHRSGRRRSSR